MLKFKGMNTTTPWGNLAENKVGDPRLGSFFVQGRKVKKNSLMLKPHF